MLHRRRAPDSNDDARRTPPRGGARELTRDLDPSRPGDASHYNGPAVEMTRAVRPQGGGTPRCGPGVTRSSREKRTPSALRGSAQPEAVFDRIDWAVP